MRTIKVFIASPGDLAVERRAFKDTIDELNKGFGRGANVEFLPLGWEDALSTVGRRSQSVINADVDACDVFILAMWRRWGQEAPDARPYSSYTEEEFYRALARFEKDGSPTIFVFFKHIDPGQMADPGVQLAKVLDFRKRLEQTRKVLYREFENDADFKLEIDRHLAAFAKGIIENPPENHRVPLLPDSVMAEIELLKLEALRAINQAKSAREKAEDVKARVDASEQLSDAVAEKMRVTLAESAAKAALDGHVEQARQDFARALDGTTNLRVLYLGYEFFTRLGELDEAERLIRRWLAVSGPDAVSAQTAAAYGSLGIVMQTRGDLDLAEQMYRKALTINEQLGQLEGVASSFGNLGTISKIRGDLISAEAMHRKALEINKKLGRTDGMAASYGNLGLLLQTRGNLDGAEAMQRKAMELNEKLGHLEGVCAACHNLGLIYMMRGDLRSADQFLRSALSIAERISDRIAIAKSWGVIGEIAEARGNYTEAGMLWSKAIAIFVMIGPQNAYNYYLNKLNSLSHSQDSNIVSLSNNDLSTAKRSVPGASL